MRRRRSRNRSDATSSVGALSRLPRLLLLLIVLLPVAEWGASMLVQRWDAQSSVVPLSDKDIAKLYDSADPGHYRQVLSETPQVRDGAYTPLTEYHMPARHGQFVTVSAAGLRGPVAAGTGPRVVVFGGGTVFGAGLADDETIPAALDRALRRAGIAARVENHGVPGWYSTQDRIAFAQMLAVGDKPEVAVFLHGLDDFLHCGQPEQTAWSVRLATAGVPASVEQLVRQSALAKVFRRALNMPEPGQVVERQSDCSADATVEAALARLEANRRMIKAMADGFGVKVLFVQQPVPTFHYDNAKRAVPLDPEQMMPYVPTAKAYARLAEMRGRGVLTESHLLWLAGLEPGEGNAYIDPVHYSPAFAALIGEAVAGPVGKMLAPAETVPAPMPPAVPGPAAPGGPVSP